MFRARASKNQNQAQPQRQSSAPSRRRAARHAALGRAVDHTLEALESRRLFAVTAAVNGGVLTVTGDNGNNAITVSRDLAGTLFVNGGAVAISGGTPTVANT